MYKKRTTSLPTEFGDSSSAEPETDSDEDSGAQTDLLTEWDDWISHLNSFLSSN